MEYHHPNTSSDQAFEMINVHDWKVACAGSDGVLGHPRVFLTIEHEIGHVVCPYCSRMFVHHDASHTHA